MSKIKVVITKDYEELSKKAFDIMADVLRKKPDAVLGLATGSTPVGLYQKMIEDCKNGGISYKKVKTVNLDEYVGLTPDNDQSYRYFMRNNLLDHIDIDLKNTNIENGVAADLQAECARYDALLDTLPRDVQVLGIGANGHIAFNEPGTPFDSRTHVVDLTENTIQMNARFFASEADVPRKALTMGLKSIMDAKKILILAVGQNKADAVNGMLNGPVDPALPASILQLHPDCTLIADQAAAALLK